MTSRRTHVLLSLVAIVAAACGDGGAHDGHGPGDPAHDDAHAHAHVHAAPHGGTLVVLAEEALHVEFVLDPAEGRLTAYVLDAHAENGVRIAQKDLAVTLRNGGVAVDLALAAVANAVTGETAGDTSEFTAASDALRGAASWEGSLRSIDVRGARFTDVAFRVGGGDR